LTVLLLYPPDSSEVEQWSLDGSPAEKGLEQGAVQLNLGHSSSSPPMEHKVTVSSDNEQSLDCMAECLLDLAGRGNININSNCHVQKRIMMLKFKKNLLKKAGIYDTVLKFCSLGLNNSLKKKRITSVAEQHLFLKLTGQKLLVVLFNRSDPDPDKNRPDPKHWL
jgi:hypothetical protein